MTTTITRGSILLLFVEERFELGDRIEIAWPPCGAFQRD